MACREGEIRLVGREVRKSAELQRRLIRFAIEIWVAAACRKAIKGWVACHGASNFFEATPPSLLCRKRMLFETRMLGGLEGKIFGFGRWRRLASIFYGMPIRLEEIVSPNTEKWQRFAVVNGRRALFPSSRPALTA